MILQHLPSVRALPQQSFHIQATMSLQRDTLQCVSLMDFMDIFKVLSA